MYVKKDFGLINISATTVLDIWLSPSDGDKTLIFSYNDLYEVTDSIHSYYFRLNGRAYNHLFTEQTYLYDLAYGFQTQPPPGLYNLKSYSNTKAPIFGRTIDTVGDSITWWHWGRYLRCLMRDKGLRYDFNGNNTDVFGLNHDGNGGDKTTDVLAKMPSIPVSDAYFVLIGTNDKTTDMQVFNNIVEISQKLHEKNSQAKIYISTLLPRRDHFNTLNQSVNNKLRSFNGWCSKCMLIDLGGKSFETADWTSYLTPDGLHPNYSGYQFIADYITEIIN